MRSHSSCYCGCIRGKISSMNSPFESEADTDKDSHVDGTTPFGKERRERSHPTSVNPNHLVISLVILLGIGNAAVPLVISTLPSTFYMQIGFLSILFFTFISLAMGMLCAQVVLHSVWTVFGNWSMGRRVMLSGSTALLLFGSLVLPTVLADAFKRSNSLPTWEEAMSIALCAPVALLAFQAPYWALRGGLGWRVVTSTQAKELAKPTPLSIQHLLLATAVVAVGFATIRSAATLLQTNVTEFTIGFTVALGVWAIMSLIATVPVVIATLRARNAVLWVSATLLSYVVIAAIFFGVAYIASGPPYPRLVDLLPLFAVFVGFFLLLTAPLLIARRMGYRLQNVEATLREQGVAPQEHKPQSPFGERAEPNPLAEDKPDEVSSDD